MATFEYPDSPYPIGPKLREAYRRAWDRVAAPGTWWTGPERVAIAAEVRGAASCPLCRERADALSPFAAEGEHESTGALPEAVVDQIHRVVTDPARLTRAWFEKLQANGVADTHYVETLGVVVATVSIDAFHRALGLPLEPLPEPLPGEPSRRRPPGAAPDAAWVPMIRENRLSGEDADLYGGRSRTGNVLRALSLVPDEVRSLLDLSAVMYMPPEEMTRFEHDRVLDRGQIELVAGRVSALRECFY